METARPTATPRADAMRLITAFRQSQCVRVAVSLRLPELLGEGAWTVDELARTTGTHAAALRRLLRALVAMGLVTEADGRYATTSLGDEFRADRIGPAATFFNAELHWSAWLRLDHSVRTGDRAFDLVHGKRNWELYAGHAEHGAAFDRAMRAMTGPIAAAVVRAWDFSRYGTVVDVGGGDGTLLSEILRANPEIRGVLFDRPDVVARAETRLQEFGDRCRSMGGSFLEQVPEGGDCYILKSILHDWDDPDARLILERVRAAMAAGAELLVVERVLRENPGPEDLDDVLSDLNMMVNNGGGERTRDEFGSLLESAGFRLEGVTPTGTTSQIVSAVAA